MYLSNNHPGRPSNDLYEFKRADLDGRRQIASNKRSPSLVIWQLHDCAASAVQDPSNAFPLTKLALELAKDLDDPDLLSWAYSEFGNVHRVLSDYEAAKDHLNEAIRLAVSPHQQADANRQRGNLSLCQYDSRAAFDYLNRAFEISSAATPRINSDRGHPMVLQTKALAHLYHAALHDEAHIEIAIPLLEAVLETGCRRHAPRARLAALNNLVAIPLNHDRLIEQRLVDRLSEAYSALRQKSSFLGARIRWVLLGVEIQRKGFSEARRRRLMTVRTHFLEKKAYRQAALLTLDIAINDIKVGSSQRAFHLLDRSSLIFSQGGLAELSRPLLSSYLTLEALLSARKEALTQSFTRKRLAC